MKRSCYFAWKRQGLEVILVCKRYILKSLKIKTKIFRIIRGIIEKRVITSNF